MSNSITVTTLMDMLKNTYLGVVIEADISHMIDVVSWDPDMTKCPLAATHLTTSICLTTEQT